MVTYSVLVGTGSISGVTYSLSGAASSVSGVGRSLSDVTCSVSGVTVSETRQNQSVILQKFRSRFVSSNLSLSKVSSYLSC